MIKIMSDALADFSRNNLIIFLYKIVISFTSIILTYHVINASFSHIRMHLWITKNLVSLKINIQKYYAVF